MKKILIIQANPDKKSYCHYLAEAYQKGATKSGAEVRFLELSDLEFNLNLSDTYKKETFLEPDLKKAQELISWAEHLVFVYPTWWATFPALLKGFFDRTFTSGFAFRYRSHTWRWDKLLTGKSARLIVTMDAPPLFYCLFTKKPGHNAVKKGVLQFCGVNPVRITSLGPVKGSSETRRKQWLEKIENYGFKQV